jgi:hypothetical protein
LQGFEAIGSVLCPFVAGRVYQAVLRQSSKRGLLVASLLVQPRPPASLH